MKRILASFLFGTICITLFAQAPLPTEADIDAFYNSKTLVVLEGGLFSSYNVYIKEEIGKYWKITPFEIISEQEFDEKKTDNSYSFLVVTQTRFERDRDGVNYTFLNLLLGADVSAISEMPEFGSIPLSYTGVENENYSYKLGIMIKFLQNRVEEFKKNPNVPAMKPLKYYNKNSSQIKTNTLYLLEGDLTPKVQQPKDIMKYYPYDFKIVTTDELSAIVSNDESAYFLHCVGPETSQREGWSFKMIFGIQDGNLYYYGIHTISAKKPGGFLDSDFKRIAK
ncbi:MAG: hypothetical protein QNK30_07420 [Bacteroidales bacterium]|nr:hypothetical protein [Bacteroidales bacterium]